MISLIGGECCSEFMACEIRKLQLAADNVKLGANTQEGDKRNSVFDGSDIIHWKPEKPPRDS